MFSGKNIVAVTVAAFWIVLSEFFRNEWLLKHFWTDHYREMGLVFPATLVNRAMWGVWSILFALTVFFIAKKFTLWQTVFLSWLPSFVMMWVVIGNLDVLPHGFLKYVIPLSLLETAGATWIVKKMV